MRQRLFLSLFLLFSSAIAAQNGVPPYRPTPEMEGFFTEDDRDLYEYRELEEEQRRRAERQGIFRPVPARRPPAPYDEPYPSDNEGVPRYRPTPQMEGFFTEDDRDLYEFQELEDEQRRRAERQGIFRPLSPGPAPENYESPYDPRYDRIPRPTSPMERGLFSEEDRGWDDLQEGEEERSEEEALGAYLPSRAKPIGPEKGEGEKRKAIVLPCENCLILPGTALLIVGGGIGAGYAAGHHSSWTRDIDVEKPKCFPKSKVATSLEWIPPEGIEGRDVCVELFQPDQRLYARTTLNQGGLPPPIPSLGEGDFGSQKGVYIAVFTLAEEATTELGGGFLGGVRVQGEDFLTIPFLEGMTLEKGTQTKIFFEYP